MTNYRNEVRLSVTAYFLTTIALVLVGLGAWFGPARWSTADSYDVILETLPLRTWGAIFTGVGAVKVALFCMGVMARRIGCAIGGMAALFWMGGFIAAGILGDLDGWTTVPVWAVFSGVQLAAAAWQRW